MAPLERMKSDPCSRFSQALTIGYLEGLLGNEPDAELGRANPRYEEGWLLGAGDRERGIEPKRFMGYHRDDELPIKQGSVVTIKKGTLVRCNGVVKPAGRTYKVIVRSLGCGSNLLIEGSAFREQSHPLTCPTVMWSGTGGYWAEADINDIPEAFQQTADASV
jgi:hypothetical protein